MTLFLGHLKAQKTTPDPTTWSYKRLEIVKIPRPDISNPSPEKFPCESGFYLRVSDSKLVCWLTRARTTISKWSQVSEVLSIPRKWWIILCIFPFSCLFNITTTTTTTTKQNTNNYGHGIWFEFEWCKCISRKLICLNALYLLRLQLNRAQQAERSHQVQVPLIPGTTVGWLKSMHESSHDPEKGLTSSSSSLPGLLLSCY